MSLSIILDWTSSLLETFAAGLKDGNFDSESSEALGGSVVEQYVMFLTSLKLTADINERQLALTRAQECGLNIHRVAVVTAERTIDTAFELLPQMKGPLPSVIALQATPSDVELLLLRSIEWMMIEDGMYDTVLEQATEYLHYQQFFTI
ncbi:hypothetical protein BD769DRAFT_1668078 [Suillus cothurnatus]|nr:hypothetical protein BD769DRAFT_1668078 [Suillus cothurnatus]